MIEYHLATFEELCRCYRMLGDGRDAMYPDGCEPEPESYARNMISNNLPLVVTDGAEPLVLLYLHDFERRAAQVSYLAFSRRRELLPAAVEILGAVFASSALEELHGHIYLDNRPALHIATAIGFREYYRNSHTIYLILKRKDFDHGKRCFNRKYPRIERESAGGAGQSAGD